MSESVCERASKQMNADSDDSTMSLLLSLFLTDISLPEGQANTGTNRALAEVGARLHRQRAGQLELFAEACAERAIKGTTELATLSAFDAS
mgnify:CR=1 FL=1